MWGGGDGFAIKVNKEASCCSARHRCRGSFSSSGLSSGAEPKGLLGHSLFTQMSIQTQSESASHTILVVEDEVLLRLDLAYQLRCAGFDVIEADSGDEALAILKAKDDVDLILTDIRMPGEIDGARLARSVRRQTQDIKIVILSAYSDTQHELPVDAAFTKPVRIEALLTKVRQLLLASPSRGSEKPT